MPDQPNGAKLQSLSEDDWGTLVSRIGDGRCTPIIGPGAYSEVVPLNLTIAEAWTRASRDYPFDGFYEIGRVAQFLSVVAADPLVPKDEVIRQLKSLAPPDFSKEDEPHRVLASLPLPIYLTTNYDDFMVRALRSRRAQDKTPVREYCRWNEYLQRLKSVVFEDTPPTVPNPVVYHLNGHNEVAESLVLTDDDYLDFLVNIAEDNSLIPERIQRALSGTSLLLLGYRLDDWNFRVLFRSIVIFLQRGLKKTHVAVQLAPEFGKEAPADQQRRAQEYFRRYFGIRDVKVYWGTCQEFVLELHERWEAANANE